MHRFDGAEQYFTRAVDFGFSFTIDETFEKWGRDEITADYVRLIRMIRPDVILGLRPDGDGGGQHHQASAIIARDAFKARRRSDEVPRAARRRACGPGSRRSSTSAAASAVRPSARRRRRSCCRSTCAVYDPLLGRTYAEIGTEARSMHKCQGMAQLLSLPGPAPSTFELVESTLPGRTAARPSSRSSTASTTRSRAWRDSPAPGRRAS